MDQIAKLLTGAMGAAMVLPAAAHAQPVTNPDGRAVAEVLKPLAIVEIADLDFGTVVTSNSGGSVFIPADGSATVYSGGVTGVATDPTVRAEFLVAGVPSSDVIITHTWPAKLDSLAGDQIDLQIMYLNGSPIKTLDATTGWLTLHFGGTIFVPANTPDGSYENNFTVTVEYR